MVQYLVCRYRDWVWNWSWNILTKKILITRKSVLANHLLSQVGHYGLGLLKNKANLCMCCPVTIFAKFWRQECPESIDLTVRSLNKLLVHLKNEMGTTLKYLIIHLDLIIVKFARKFQSLQTMASPLNLNSW